MELILLKDKRSHLTLSSGDANVRSAKILRKRPGAPTYVREFVRLIREVASEGEPLVEFGMVEVKIGEVLLHCDEKGKKFLKGEEKLQRGKVEFGKKKKNKKEK